jgi:hypothetical protein
VNGLRISRPPESPALRSGTPETEPARGSGATFVSAGTSDFSRWFAPLKPVFGRWKWVLHAEPHLFRFPDHWHRDHDEESGDFSSPELREAERWVLEEKDDWRLVDGRYLEAVADTLLDDWADFFALAEPAPGLDAFTERYWAARDPEAAHALLSATVPLHFSCVDGAVWEVHAKDPALLAAVRAHLAALPAAAATDSSLMQSLRRYDGGA